MSDTPKCVGCHYAKLTSTARATGNNRHLGGPRSEFMCRHQDAEKVFKQVCPRSYKMPGFIGFSHPGKIVPAIKTSPRWCPLRDRKEVQ